MNFDSIFIDTAALIRIQNDKHKPTKNKCFQHKCDLGRNRVGERSFEIEKVTYNGRTSPVHSTTIHENKMNEEKRSNKTNTKKK